MATEPSTVPILFENCSLLDPAAGLLLPGRHVLVEGDRIREVGERPLRAHGATVLDLAGRTLMPGLCDAHVHVTAVVPDLARLERLSPAYVTAGAIRVLGRMARRGFTTVRDAGGADWGLAAAVREGLCEGPEILHSGHALSQTGGHGDMRSPGEDRRACGHPAVGTLGRICDGVPEVRRAAREELRRGARQIKIMASGGAVSPSDPVASVQFSREEILAIVDEAERFGTYVMAHAYTARAIERALECGVRSIEHGNLADAGAVDLLVARGAFLVPTLATYELIHREGRKAGMAAATIEKIEQLREGSLAALRLAAQKGAKIAFGTDLVCPMDGHQPEEFRLRAEVQTPAEIIRSATTVCAELFGMVGEIGEIAPGARADLLAVEGNPLEDLRCLQEPEVHLSVVMARGRFLVNRLQRRAAP